MTARKVKTTKAKKPKKPLKTAMRGTPPNRLFPGRPNYVGPKTGYFAFLHHQQLFEESTQRDVAARVNYVRSQKPSNEKPRRLHQMMCLNKCTHVKALVMLQKIVTMLHPFGYETRRPAEQAYERLREKMRQPVLEYVKTYIPDVVWNEEQMTIFPDGKTS